MAAQYNKIQHTILNKIREYPQQKLTDEEIEALAEKEYPPLKAEWAKKAFLKGFRAALQSK